MICSRSLRRTTGGREGHHVAHHLGRVGGVVHQRLGADGDLVAEQGGDLVGVSGAADVPQQRDPVDGVAQRRRPKLGLVAHPHREEARAQLRLERLAEGVVLRQRERGDEFTEAKRRGQNGEISRCMDQKAGGPFAHHGATPMSRRAQLETFYP